MQAQAQVMPDILEPVFGLLDAATKVLNDNLGPVMDTLGCPQLNKMNMDALKDFPGAKYFG